MKTGILGAALLLAFAAPVVSQTCTPGGGVTCTPNLNLWVPPLGYQNWNVALNANWNILDALTAAVHSHGKRCKETHDS